MTSKDVNHTQRIYQQLDSAGAKAAFFELIEFCLRERRLTVHSLSRGAFSALHISTKAGARPYADAEFAFKGAKSHLKFWFRQPAFDSALVSATGLQEKFGDRLQTRSDGVCMVDLLNREDAAEIVTFLSEVLEKKSDR